jgi:hypothetical protein
MTDNMSSVCEVEFFGMSPADYLQQAASLEALNYARAMLLKEGLLSTDGSEFIEELAFIVWDLEKIAADAIYNSLSDVDKVEYMRLLDSSKTANEAISFANSRTRDLAAITVHAWDNFKYQWEQVK